MPMLSLALRMLCVTLLSVTVAAADPGDKNEAGKAKPDEELLQGSWRATSGTLNGKTADPAFTKEHAVTFTFRAAGYTMTEATTKEVTTRNAGVFKVEAGKSPKRMTVTGTDGPTKGMTVVFIYELTGNSLKLGIPARGPGWAGPPERFDQADVAVIVLERVKE